MSATTQMNLRIDTTLKRDGDAALAAAGYTPTQAVRALWRHAARHRGRPEVIREGLSFGANDDRTGITDEARSNSLAIRQSADADRRFGVLGATSGTLIDVSECSQNERMSFGRLI